jgi:hypothetical protein
VFALGGVSERSGLSAGRLPASDRGAPVPPVDQVKVEPKLGDRGEAIESHPPPGGVRAPSAESECAPGMGTEQEVRVLWDPDGGNPNQ